MFIIILQVLIRCLPRMSHVRPLAYMYDEFLMFLFCTLFVANSAQTSSSISPGVIAGVAIVVVIGTVAVIFVVCVYIVRKSRGSIPAAHHSAPEPSSLHYPRQQGVTYHTHSGTIEKYSCRDIMILLVLVMQTSNLHWL